MGIVKALEMDGLDCRVLFKQLGLDYSALDDPDARFPQDSMTRLWQRAVEVSGNPAIGLNMGKVVRPASFHVAGYALMSSNTLVEGFQRLVRYQRIIAESADLSFRLLDEGYALILTVHGDHLPPTRQSAEASLACALALCGWLSGRTLHPVKVLLQGDEPADLQPYKHAFHAPLVFNAPYDALIFERADMEAPLPTANEAMALLHDRFAGEYLARFSERPTRRGRCSVGYCLRASPSAIRWRRLCTCRNARCSAGCRRRARVFSSCSMTLVANWPNSTWRSRA